MKTVTKEKCGDCAKHTYEPTGEQRPICTDLRVVTYCGESELPFIVRDSRHKPVLKNCFKERKPVQS